MSAPNDFQSQRHPVAGMEDAAKGFFERERAKHAPAAAESGAEQATPSTPTPEEIPAPVEEPAPGTTPPVEEEEEPQPQAADGLEEEPEAEQLEIPDEATLQLPDGREVSLADLKKGYMQEGDYTRKAQELADQRRTLETHAQEGIARAQQLDQLIATMQQDLADKAPNQAALNHLRQTDPAEYSARMIEMQQRNQLLANAQQQRQALLDQQQAQAIPLERDRLQALVPAFAEDFAAEYRKLGAWIVSPDGGGLRPEEWNQVIDHRYVALAHKAMQYDEAARKKAPQVTHNLAKLPRRVRPGIQRDPGQASEDRAKAAMDNLKANPNSTEAIAAAFKEREVRRREHLASRTRGPV